MTKSPKRLAFLAVCTMALALVVTPMSFAGEDDGDPGPTQAGETFAGENGTGGSGPASVQGPVSNSNNSAAESTNNASVKKSHKVKAANRDVVRAQGGIQAGFGGMATQATSSFPMTLAFSAGILLIILAGAATFTPLRLHSQK
jgi:hypothetical protein